MTWLVFSKIILRRVFFMKNTGKKADNLSKVLKDYLKPEIEVLDLGEDVLSTSSLDDPWGDDLDWHD